MTSPGTASGSAAGTASAGAPEVVELARALIRTPSPNPPGDERAVVALLNEAMAACGLPPARVIARDPRRPNGRRVRASVRDAVAAGIALVPEERKTDGLVLPLPVRANTTLASLRSVTSGGWLSARREREAFDAEQRRLRIRTAGPDQGTWQLSGGNQQKIVLAKWLRTRPRVLLLDEPTRGIDVGTKAEIYRIVRELAAAGMAVVVVSSDLPEVTGLAHRVIVCRQGQVVGELSGEDIAEEKVMNLALGLGEVAS